MPNKIPILIIIIENKLSLCPFFKGLDEEAGSELCTPQNFHIHLILYLLVCSMSYLKTIAYLTSVL